MNAEKLSVIRTYLSQEFVDCPIEENWDSKRKAQTFKVHIPNDTVLLKVGQEVVSDNSANEIRHCLNLYKVSEKLQAKKNCGALITQDRVQLFLRD